MCVCGGGGGALTGKMDTADCGDNLRVNSTVVKRAVALTVMIQTMVLQKSSTLT